MEYQSEDQTSSLKINDSRENAHLTVHIDEAFLDLFGRGRLFTPQQKLLTQLLVFLLKLFVLLLILDLGLHKLLLS